MDLSQCHCELNVKSDDNSRQGFEAALSTLPPCTTTKLNVLNRRGGSEDCVHVELYFVFICRTRESFRSD